MENVLKTLYWNLYTPCTNEEAEQELDDCHKQLIDVLGKPERKLVLRIIDGKDRLADKIGYERDEVIINLVQNTEEVIIRYLTKEIALDRVPQKK